MEYLNLYNKDKIKLNKVLERGWKPDKGEYFKVVHVWLKNSQGDYLIQQRNKASDTIPYQWAPTAGTVQKDESPLDCAIRETGEELGVKLKEEDLLHIHSLVQASETNNYIIDVFLVAIDLDLNELVIDPLEVKAVQYASLDRIIEMIKEDIFWDFINPKVKKLYFKKLEKRKE